MNTRIDLRTREERNLDSSCELILQGSGESLAMDAYHPSAGRSTMWSGHLLPRLALFLVGWVAQGSSPREVAWAQAKGREEIVKAEAHLNVDRLPAARRCRFLVRLTIAPGWHIGAHKVSEDQVPTEVQLKSQLGTKILTIEYPKGKRESLSYSSSPVWVYERRVDLYADLEVPESAGGMKERLEILIRYQACNDEQCLLPKTIKLAAELPVAARGESVREINAALFKSREDQPSKP